MVEKYSQPDQDYPKQFMARGLFVRFLYIGLWTFKFRFVYTSIFTFMKLDHIDLYDTKTNARIIDKTQNDSL